MQSIKWASLRSTNMQMKFPSYLHPMTSINFYVTLILFSPELIQCEIVIKFAFDFSRRRIFLLNFTKLE